MFTCLNDECGRYFGIISGYRLCFLGQRIVVNFFDVLVTLNVIGFGISGYVDGLIKGFVKLCGFVITIAVTALLSDSIIQLSREIDFLSPKIAVPVTFIVIFVAGLIGFNLLGDLLRKVVRMTPAGFIDSGLGSAFGVLKALLLNGVIALILSLTPQDSFLWVQYDSSQFGTPLVAMLTKTVPFVKSTAKMLYELVPHPENH